MSTKTELRNYTKEKLITIIIEMENGVNRRTYDLT